MTARADSEAGFTLIEALVAMSVLALGAVSLLSAAEGHTRQISELSERVSARWVADEALTHLRLGLTPDDRNIPMYGRSFDITHDRAETSDPDVQKISLRVNLSGTDRTLFVLDGYVDTGAPS